jgi:crotonobetainyl-CoA:carnitine CoA-transferase CaiB-like acyl-CoA transferase
VTDKESAFAPKSPPSQQLLSGLRVLDLTIARSGPSAARLLGDWGADVIKIESISRKDISDRSGSDYQNLHRNKRSLSLNLKDPRGHEILMRLVKRADVLMENFRADVKRRLNIDYETLRAENPRLVYASISGFGQDGPYAERPAYDHIIQGMGGLMSVTGLPGQGPVRVGIAISDLAAGLYCATGVLGALYERERSGEGQWVTLSLLEAQIALLDFQATRWLVDGETPQQTGNGHPTMPGTGLYPTRDGYINIAVAGDDGWRRFCKALDLDVLLDDPRFASSRGRLENRILIDQMIEGKTATRDPQELVATLNTLGVPCGPVYTIDRMFADPQVQHIDMTRSVEHPTLGPMRLVRQPVSFSRSAERSFEPTPDKGQHNQEILAAAGYSSAEIESLRAGGVI